jgi:surface antigen
MDQRDCAQAQLALARIRDLPVGQPVTWQSPTGSYGAYTPVSAEFRGPNNTFCRNVNQEATLAGHEPTQSIVMTCRTPSGNYETVQPATT